MLRRRGVGCSVVRVLRRHVALHLRLLLGVTRLRLLVGMVHFRVLRRRMVLCLRTLRRRVMLRDPRALSTMMLRLRVRPMPVAMRVLVLTAVMLVVMPMVRLGVGIVSTFVLRPGHGGDTDKEPFQHSVWGESCLRIKRGFENTPQNVGRIQKRERETYQISLRKF